MNIGEKGARAAQMIDRIVEHGDESTSARGAVLDYLASYIEQKKASLSTEDANRVVAMLDVAKAGVVDPSLPPIGASVSVGLNDAVKDG